MSEAFFEICLFAIAMDKKKHRHNSTQRPQGDKICPLSFFLEIGPCFDAIVIFFFFEV
jgi:hypothetical protein